MEEPDQLPLSSSPDVEACPGHATSAGAHTYSRKDSAFQATAAVSVSLTFQEISYKVVVRKDKNRKEKVILNRLSGHVQPGTFVAIMGPSGAGKTCLLNVLAGRVERSGKSTVEGQVLINGRPRDHTFRRVSAYVMQDDAMFSCLTVWETLWVAARLRLPSSFSLSQKLDLANSVISELGLGQARNTMIGGAMVRGVSGGERKRTSIAVEMLSNPSLVFLDEPTSGLDSFQAQNIMMCMSDLARGGRTVISTIHQPRSSIFALFEDLILLSEGDMVYSGKARDSVQYFASRGLRCPELYNPADYFMDMISVDRRSPEVEEESEKRVKALVNSFEDKTDYSLPSLDLHSEKDNNTDLCKGRGHSKYASGFVIQFTTLCCRAFWQVTRDKLPLLVAWAQALVMTLIISLLFYAPAEGAQQIQNMQGSLFFVCVFMAFNGIFQMIITFPFERGVINRERASNCYRISAYYPAKVLLELPFRVLPAIFFLSVSYWPLQFQRTAEKFFLYLAVGVLEFTAMNSVGIFIGAAAPTPETALGFGPIIAVLFSLFGGLFVNLETIPIWLRWLRYLSPVQWAFVGFTTNQFTGLTFTCAPGEQGCVTSGEQILQNLGVDNFTVGEAIGCQAALIVGLHLLAFTTLTLNGPKMQPLLENKGKKS